MEYSSAILPSHQGYPATSQLKVKFGQSYNFYRPYNIPSDLTFRPMSLNAWTQTSSEDFAALRESNSGGGYDADISNGGGGGAGGYTKREQELLEKIRVLEDSLKQYSEFLEHIHNTTAKTRESLASAMNASMNVSPGSTTQTSSTNTTPIEVKTNLAYETKVSPGSSGSMKSISPRSCINSLPRTATSQKDNSVTYKIVSDGGCSNADEGPIEIQLAEDNSGLLNTSAESDRLQIVDDTDLLKDMDIITSTPNHTLRNVLGRGESAAGQQVQTEYKVFQEQNNSTEQTSGIPYKRFRSSFDSNNEHHHNNSKNNTNDGYVPNMEALSTINNGKVQPSAAVPSKVLTTNHSKMNSFNNNNKTNNQQQQQRTNQSQVQIQSLNQSVSQTQTFHQTQSQQSQNHYMKVGRELIAKKEIVSSQDVTDGNGLRRAYREYEVCTVVTEDDPGETSKENIMVSIGPNNTRVPAKLYESMNWNSASIATRKLLVNLFGRDVLATHSMTGKPSPAFKSVKKPLKQMLDPSIIQDIIFVVTRKCNVSEKEVRNAITTKCADENKMMKLQLTRKQALLEELNKENVYSNNNEATEEIKHKI